MRPRRRQGGRLVALGLGLVMSLGMVEAGSRIVFPGWREFSNERFMDIVDVPGYPPFSIGRRGFDGYFAQNNGDFRIHIRINDAGLRNDAPVAAADGRLWAIGDSFTFGWGVERDQIFDAVAGKLAGMPSYGIASPGTNVCGYQALLARMPADIRPGALIVGLTLENDVTIYDGCQPPKLDDAPPATPFRLIRVKLFLTSHSAAYNFLAVALKRVGTVRETLISLGLVEREHVDHSGLAATDLTARIASTADELAKLKAMLPAGTPVAVLIIPGRTEIQRGDPVFHRLRLDIAEALQSRGIATIDPFESLAKAGLTVAHFAHDGHWSAEGHALAGAEAAKWLAGTRAAVPETAVPLEQRP